MVVVRREAVHQEVGSSQTTDSVVAVAIVAANPVVLLSGITIIIDLEDAFKRIAVSEKRGIGVTYVFRTLYSCLHNHGDTVVQLHVIDLVHL